MRQLLGVFWRQCRTLGRRRLAKRGPAARRARLLGCTQRAVERFLQDALDQLSRILLAGGLMEQLPPVTEGSKTCPEKNYNFDLSDTNQGGNIEKLAVHPSSGLIF